jgi:hypothetical protein
MTKNLKGKQASMFDALAKKSTGRVEPPEVKQSISDSFPESKLQKDVSEDEEPKPMKQRRKRSKTGKRSDPDYTQVGCYLPRDLNNRVKVKLVGDSRDFSDLTAELLEQWLSD